MKFFNILNFNVKEKNILTFLFSKIENCGIIEPMSEVGEFQSKDPIIIIEEKGDLNHAIRCAEQAQQRAEAPWLKRACAYRVKMLQIQLARQKNKNI